MLNKTGGANQRLAIMLGMLTNDKEHPIKANIPNGDRSLFSMEKYKFMLEAPFEISNKCCNVMKKSPTKRTKVRFITATMASESRLRTQKWLQHGCNAFDAKNPISNPMSFWVNQDVLLYIRLHDLPVCPIYGNVVTEDEYTGQVSLGSLLGLDETELFDLERPSLRTTGVDRSGCIFCGFGAFIEKESRFDLIDKVSNPALRDFCFRGGAFDEDGLFKPDNKGLGYWFVMKWINLAGNFNAYIPEYERYEKEYGNERTAKELEKALQIGMSTKK